MADNLGQLYFELGVRDNVSPTVDKIQQSFERAQKAAFKALEEGEITQKQFAQAMRSAYRQMERDAAYLIRLWDEFGAKNKSFIPNKGANDLSKTYEQLFDKLGRKADELRDKMSRFHGDAASNTAYQSWARELSQIEAQMQNIVLLNEQMRNRSIRTASTEQEVSAHQQAADATMRHQQKLGELNQLFDEQAQKEKASADATKQQLQAQKDAIEVFTRVGQNLEKVKKEYQSLFDTLLKLRNVRNNASSMGIDTTKIDQSISNTIQKLHELRDIMRNAYSSGSPLQNKGFSVSGADTKSEEAAIKRLIQEIQRLITEKQKSAQASRRAAEESAAAARRAAQPLRDLAREFRNLQDAASRSSQIIGDLKSMLYQFGSIYGIQQMVMSIITVGGELEKQHIALQSIIGDVTKANVLFEQTKELALQSPFTFSELNRDVKQLAAYGVEYDDLYDTTKRLADISAGLGVSFERIALAFGQTKARSWLDGKELRQFAYAGIPLMKKLSDMYSELEGRRVSNSEVKNRIFKRQVSFEDVRKILWDMTDESGQFYNMQMVLSETLLGRYNKLKDAWEIMLADFAKGDSIVGGSLKTILDLVTELVLAFHNLAPVIAMAFAPKAIMGFAAMLGGSGNLRKNLLAVKASQAAGIQQKALTGAALTSVEKRLLATKEKITMVDLRTLAASKAITQQELNRLRVSGQITAAQYKQLATMAGLQAQGGRLLLTFRMMGNAVGNVFKGAWSMIGGWAGVAFAAIGGVISLWSKYDQSRERAAQIEQDAISKSKQDLQEWHDVMKEVMAPSADLSAEQMSEGIKKMTEYLHEHAVNYDDIMKNAFSKDAEGRLKSLADRYEELYVEMMNVKDAEELMKNGKGVSLESALNETNGGIFTRSIQSELKDMQKEYNDWERKITRYYKKYKNSIEGGINAARAQDEAFKEATKNMESYSKMMMYLIQTEDKYKDAFSAFDNYNDQSFVALRLGRADYSDYYNEATEAYNKLFEMSENFADQMIAEHNSIENMTKSQLMQVLMAIDSFLNSEEIAGLDDWIKNIIGGELWKRFADKGKEFGLTFKLNKGEVKEEVNELEQEIKRFVGEDYNLNLKTATNMPEVIKQVREQVDTAKKTIENMKPIMLKFGLSMDLGKLKAVAAKLDSLPIPDFLKSGVKSALDSVIESLKTVQSGEKIAKEYGFGLTDPTKGSKKKTGGSGGSKADEQLKKWREELKELQKFWQEYETLLKRMSSSEAVEEIRKNGIVPGLFGQNGELLVDVRAGLEQALDNLLARTDAKTTERKSFQIEIKDAKFKVHNKTAEEAAEAILKQLDEELKKRGKQWDMYKKIVDATGNKPLAAQASFGSSVSFGNMAEELRSQITEALSKKSQTGITVDDLLGMDDNQLAELGIVEKGVDGIYNRLKLLREEELKLKETQADLLIEALKNAKDLDDELAEITNKYAKTREAIDGSTMTQDEKNRLTENANKNEGKEKANARWEWFKKNTEGWGEMFSDLDRVTDKAISDMITKLEELLPNIEASEEATKALYEAYNKLKNEQVARNPFMGLWNNVKTITNTNASESDRRKANSDFNKQLKAIGDKFKALEDILQPVIDLFDSLGEHDIADLFKIGSNAFGAAANTAQGISSIAGMFNGESGIGKALGAAGPYGAAAAAALSVASSIFALHDKALQKEIEASERRQKEMENLTKNLERALERTLGGIYNTSASGDMLSALEKEMELDTDTLMGFTLKILGYKYKDYLKQDTVDAIEEAERTATYYDTAYASLLAQRDELQHQLDLESAKKDEDAGKIQDYQQQLKEMDDQISHFAQDMAKTIYDIDVKSWAQELGDALVDAWARGEDAVKAWKEKAASLMADLTKNIIVQKVIEGALSDVLDGIVDEMKAKKGKLDESSVVRFSNMLLEGMGAGVGTTVALLDKLNPEFERLFGVSLKDALGSSSGSSDKNVIRGEFTEQETGLLLSYVNAIRADDSIIRMDVTEIKMMLAQMPVAAQAQLYQLEFIADNTRQTAENTAMIGEIHGLLRNAQNSRDFGLYMK